jgi:hypothetical protein
VELLDPLLHGVVDDLVWHFAQALRHGLKGCFFLSQTQSGETICVKIN